MTSVATGRQQSFGTSSDVLTQQFALTVGWVGEGPTQFPKKGPCAGLEWDSFVWNLVLLPHLQGKRGHLK